jgi:hypothetical protein
MKRFAFLLLVLCTVPFVANGQNWPQFRGPGATGVVEGRPSPVKWDAEKSVNTVWDRDSRTGSFESGYLGQQILLRPPTGAKDETSMDSSATLPRLRMIKHV